MQTIVEVIKWLENLKAAIGRGENQNLWHYEQPLSEIITQLKRENLPQRKFEIAVVEGYTQIADGFIRIYGDNGNYYKEMIVDAEDDLPVSLTDCLKVMLEDTGKKLDEIEMPVYAEFCDALQGKIYQFGNYGDHKWYTYGETVGYA